VLWLAAQKSSIFLGPDPVPPKRDKPHDQAFLFLTRMIQMTGAALVRSCGIKPRCKDKRKSRKFFSKPVLKKAFGAKRMHLT
jgi:hypothetical protein